MIQLHEEFPEYGWNKTWDTPNPHRSFEEIWFH